jgi:FPC/CPF motif-containing protein YcgG
VFDDAVPLTEEEFESVMWKELSHLSASPAEASRWDPRFSSDPADKNFCFSFGGDAFFLVGMHPRSSRLARRFPFPTVVFNLFDQFEALGSAYEPMVKLNRRRDRLFQGSVNPTVERWADKWESIQYSGRDNPPDWECPFRRGRL